MAKNGNGPVSSGEYSWRIIFVRWFLTASEMALATYILIGFKFEFAILFIPYGIVCIFLLLPVIRCIRCDYYGRRCNFGWGTWVAKFFPKASDSDFSKYYGYSFIFWPLRIFPLGIGFFKVIDAALGKPQAAGLIVYGSYLLVLFIHRRFYRASACIRCSQRTKCPVYNINVMTAASEKADFTNF